MAIIIVDPSTIADPAEKTVAESVLNGIRYRLGTGITSTELPDTVLLNDIFIGSSEREILALYNEGKQDPPQNFATLSETQRQNYKIIDNTNFNLLSDILKEKLILLVQYKVLLELLYSYKDIKQLQAFDYRSTFYDIDLSKKEAEFLARYNSLLKELIPTTPTQTSRPPKPAVSTKLVGF